MALSLAYNPLMLLVLLPTLQILNGQDQKYPYRTLTNVCRVHCSTSRIYSLTILSCIARATRMRENCLHCDALRPLYGHCLEASFQQRCTWLEVRDKLLCQLKRSFIVGSITRIEGVLCPVIHHHTSIIDEGSNLHVRRSQHVSDEYSLLCHASSKMMMLQKLQTGCLLQSSHDLRKAQTPL